MPTAKMKTSKKNIYETLFEDVKSIADEPEQLLSIQEKKSTVAKDLIQKSYKVALTNDESVEKSAEILPEVIVEDLDEEQIWQQLELRNNAILSNFLEDTSKLLAIKEHKLEVRLNEDEEDDAENDLENGEAEGEEFDEESEGDNDDDVDDDGDEDYEDKARKSESSINKSSKKKLRTSIVDDKFFKLGEMEEFLEAEDAKDLRKKRGEEDEEEDDDDAIDYFAEDLGEGADDSEEEEEEANFKYKDFFVDDVEDNDNKLSVEQIEKVNAKSKKNKFKDHFAEATENGNNDENDESGEEQNENDEYEEDEDNEEGEEDDEGEENEAHAMRHIEAASGSESDSDGENNEEKPKSTFELRQERLNQRIQDYEEERLGEKPWQLKGEIQATNRPQNSLLEEILEFDSTTRPAPVITVETTRCLEDVIKQRIKDQAWDDVEVKFRPTNTPQEFRKQLVLDQEKSKESLAQIYEKEYQKEIDKLKPKGDENDEEEPKEHKEIRKLMDKLFVKLDALTNFHFIPRPVAPEAKIITNIPAVSMEEAVPTAVSDASLLAPKEVFRGPKHELVGKSERDRTEKNRERRKKKAKQRAINKVIEAKDLKRQKLGIPLTQKEEKAKLLKTITKHRNVSKLSADSNDPSSLKSSKAFFSKLQDDKTINSTGKEKNNKRKLEAKELTAKKVKL